jgi:hypothetical protein
MVSIFLESFNLILPLEFSVKSYQITCNFFLKRKNYKKFSKIQTLVFLQIPLNYNEYLNPSNFLFLFFFPKKMRGILRNFDKI